MSSASFCITISKLRADTHRLRCDRVLMSPQLYQDCVAHINSWHNEDLSRVARTMTVYGIPVEPCVELKDMEYALIPKPREGLERG